MLKGLMGKAKAGLESVDIKSKIDSAKSGLESLELKAKLETAKNATSGGFDAAKNKTKVYFEEHWPKIEEFLVKGLLDISQEKLLDEKTFIPLFEKSYELLPTPVRLVIPRERFMGFCLERKEPLVTKVISYQNDWKAKSYSPVLIEQASLSPPLQD